jgi:hypothetical protein
MKLLYAFVIIAITQIYASVCLRNLYPKLSQTQRVIWNNPDYLSSLSVTFKASTLCSIIELETVSLDDTIAYSRLEIFPGQVFIPVVFENAILDFQNPEKRNLIEYNVNFSMPECIGVLQPLKSEVYFWNETSRVAIIPNEETIILVPFHFENVGETVGATFIICIIPLFYVLLFVNWCSICQERSSKLKCIPSGTTLSMFMQSFGCGALLSVAIVHLYPEVILGLENNNIPQYKGAILTLSALGIMFLSYVIVAKVSGHTHGDVEKINNKDNNRDILPEGGLTLNPHGHSHSNHPELENHFNKNTQILNNEVDTEIGSSLPGKNVTSYQDDINSLVTYEFGTLRSIFDRVSIFVHIYNTNLEKANVTSFSCWTFNW